VMGILSLIGRGSLVFWSTVVTRLWAFLKATMISDLLGREAVKRSFYLLTQLALTLLDIINNQKAS